MNVEIRRIESLEEIHQCEVLQRKIWGFTDLSIVPHHLIRATLHAGGILIGAFLDHELVGYAYSFPGLPLNDRGDASAVRQCSFMAGVIPEHRFRGLGYELKLKQRQLTLEQGTKLITWTFDPLQSSNANFNIRKLGVISREYYRDYYGDMRDELNKGLPTDRFSVEWWIESPRVRSRVKNGPARIDSSGLSPVNITELKDGILRNVRLDLERDENLLSIEVLRNFGQLKLDFPEIASQWRTETRDLFEHYLGKGYVVSEFVVEENEPDKRAFYLLEKSSVEAILERE